MRFALMFLALGCAHAASPPAPPPAPAALVSLFDGSSLAAWDGDPALWAIRDGAIDGLAEKGGRLIYTRGDYATFRLILQSRLVSDGNHLGVCFWGNRLADHNYGDCILVIPPGGGMWDYHPGRRSPPRENLDHAKFDPHEWHTTEILADIATGQVRMAVNGVEVVRYKDIDPGRLKKGPIGLQIHAGVSQVQYRDIKIEVDPKDNRLITLKR
jgi:3-keto-disaccharide hydrolase